MTRDANKSEQAQKQINFFGYQLYEYLVQMKKCCYVSEADKQNRFGVKVNFVFYTDEHCSQVHDLLNHNI